MKLKLFKFLLILVTFVPSVQATDGHSIAHIPRGISPVYEEMVGNQIQLLHRRLWNPKSKSITLSKSFSVIGWNEEAKALATKVAQRLRMRKDSEHWQFINHRQEGRFQGAILIAVGKIDELSQEKQLEKELPEAARFLSHPQNQGFLVVFTWREPDIGQIDSIIKKYGFQIIESVSEQELEFVKDETGRQMVDLDGLKWRNLIYERFVRDGMNPVNAWPAVEEAVQNFRKSQDSKILMIGKK